MASVPPGGAGSLDDQMRLRNTDESLFKNWL